MGTLVHLLLSKRAQKLIKHQRKTIVLEEYESESESFSDFDLRIENLRSLIKLDRIRASTDESDSKYRGVKHRDGLDENKKVNLAEIGVVEQNMSVRSYDEGEFKSEQNETGRTPWNQTVDVSHASKAGIKQVKIEPKRKI